MDAEMTATEHPLAPAITSECPPPLVIAGHGTRDAEGSAAAFALVERVRELLPGVRVEIGFVELTAPSIDEALETVLADGADKAVVVPLMIGTGTHVRQDIPEAIAAGRREHLGATVIYTRHLGAPDGLIAAVDQRIATAADEWSPEQTTVVLVGRGCSVTDANADHVRLARVVGETGGYAKVVPGFIQVTSPTVAEALSEAYATGARRIVVMPHYLFPGRLATWVNQQTAAWLAEHTDAEVRVAGVIGPCPELAAVVAKRYHEGSLQARTDLGSPSYLAGLLLAGRKAVAVGGGCVNRRRVPKLIAAGAAVTIVSPQLHPGLAELVANGKASWQPRGFIDSDLDNAWYVLAATDDPATNAAVAAAAESRHTFCVRADRAELGSAWTPATGDTTGATIAVLTDHNPQRSRALRDQLISLLENADD
jgi:sirohydrochlorin cobaltochelatase